MQGTRTQTPSPWPVPWVDWPSRTGHDPVVDFVGPLSDMTSRNNPHPFVTRPLTSQTRPPLYDPISDLRYLTSHHHLTSFIVSELTDLARPLVTVPSSYFTCHDPSVPTWPRVIRPWQLVTLRGEWPAVLDILRRRYSTTPSYWPPDSHSEGQPCGRF